MIPLHTKRIGEIELIRFFAALCVMNLHSSSWRGCPVLAPGGYIGVEFFFLLSGFLMAAHMHKKRIFADAQLKIGSETSWYLYRRIASFLPELVVACGIGIIVFGSCHDWSSTLHMAYDTLMGDVLLLQMTALTPHGVEAPVWYLSSLLLVSALLYPLLWRYGHSPIWPILALMLLGYVFKSDEVTPAWGFAGAHHWMGWTLKGNLRALAELALGASLFPLSKFMEGHLRLSVRGSLLITFLKWACYGLALIQCIHPKVYAEPLALLALGGGILLSFSNLCIDRHCYQATWIRRLGRFSLPLYLSHYYWAENLAVILPSLTFRWEKLLVYHIAAILTALSVMFLAKHLRRLAALV